jgi:hypothetical protein
LAAITLIKKKKLEKPRFFRRKRGFFITKKGTQEGVLGRGLDFEFGMILLRLTEDLPAFGLKIKLRRFNACISSSLLPQTSQTQAGKSGTTTNSLPNHVR